ncbi:MAG: valine--tRNA ligase [Deltaproteobacteria bacterium]|nr:valine--tRNA ligase [Deltaproteobacteria bacterium]
MSQSFELDKVYAPHEVEDRWSSRWISERLSVGPEKLEGRKPYCVVIPPPNVTGSLHVGHGLNNTVQDILVRTHRMRNESTMWVFGTDHASIATQNVVERLIGEEGFSRHDLGREKFLERAWKWKEESGGMITRQLKRLGASLDWSRERFTMDEGLSRAVKEVFVQLYEEGLLYRDQRLINWCPRCNTALSDLEVDYHDMKGHLWHLRYAIEGSANEFLVVATTRPETLLGDTAVAVNPQDERYQNLIGKNVVIPFVNRLVPIIADDYVDQSFGTGVVKITPAHDFNDFEVGRRHNLEKINVLNSDGSLNENAGPYAGKDRFVARKEMVKALEESDQLEKIEDHQNKVGHCYRCKTVVEPYLSLQWYVKTQPLAEPAIRAVKEGKTEFFPKHWEKTYFSWMENIRDWCVSRQLWWGHQIPAWYCGQGHTTVARETPSSCSTCHSQEITQDPDVLDTWFSSGLWPFSTLGWPDKTELLKNYYPTDVLVTSFDIIFFWVARMMMFGLKFMNEVPFKHVYIHALIRDAQGQKMSKSKGNVINPLELMEKYGTDAFRFTLAAFAAQGRDIKLAEDRVEGYRNFCNKIWNAARFLYSAALPQVKSFDEILSAQAQTEEDEWILGKLSETVQTVSDAIDAYKFNEAAHALYNFIWQIFCDWYLELIKARLYSEGEQKISCSRFALRIFEETLRLLHPFMPFITEELWQKIRFNSAGYIMTAPFPKALSRDEFQKISPALEKIDSLKELVSTVRNIRAETGVLPKDKIPVFLLGNEKVQKEIESILPRFCELAKLSEVKWITSRPTEPVAKGLVTRFDAIVFVPLTGLIDIEKEKNRQKKKLDKVLKEIVLFQNKLSNENFIQNAPDELVEETKQELALRQNQKRELEEALELL